MIPRAWTYTVKLGRRRLGPFDDLMVAVRALRAARTDAHSGEVRCSLIEVPRG